jgi:hypothetical protein
VIDAIALRALSYIIYLNEQQQYEAIIKRIGIPTIKLLDTSVAAKAVWADSPPGPGGAHVNNIIRFCNPCNSINTKY